MLLQESGSPNGGPITLGLTAPFDCKCCVSCCHIGRMRTHCFGRYYRSSVWYTCVCRSSFSNYAVLLPVWPIISLHMMQLAGNEAAFDNRPWRGFVNKHKLILIQNRWLFLALISVWLLRQCKVNGSVSSCVDGNSYSTCRSFFHCNLHENVQWSNANNFKGHKSNAVVGPTFIKQRKHIINNQYRFYTWLLF